MNEPDSVVRKPLPPLPERMTLRPRPWRVLRLYFWIAAALTFGPILFGLWTVAMGAALTSMTFWEVVDEVVRIVGLMPLFGVGLVALSVPAGHMALSGVRRQRWEVDRSGVAIYDGDTHVRTIPWRDVDFVRVGTLGPVVFPKDTHTESASLDFATRDDAVLLHRYWHKVKDEAAG